MYIFLLVLGGGQDKPAWTACPPGMKITRVGGKISRDSLLPGGQGNRGWLAPRGATCPGGKINWDTGRVSVLTVLEQDILSAAISTQVQPWKTRPDVTGKLFTHWT